MYRWIVVAAVVLVAALAIRHPVPSAAPSLVALSPPPAPRSAARRLAAPGEAAVTVYVVGEILRPGLYRLPAGKRAADAVARAGGFTPAADPAGVNLAQRLNDGDQITVPKLGAQAACAPARRLRRTTSRRRKPAVRAPAQVSLDLNAASAEALAQLPGIGDRLAARIVRYREVNGPFASVDELADVSGMTDSRIQKVAPFIIVH
ncbi:MAG: ComEA family DNA-binding protein [Firmicutes bacterium]|nr:ComEA family DNA-binding protein [Bacillota bacterium]